MSVFIKGMKMPESCDECRFAVDGWCYACEPESREECMRITTNYCPLVPVPPHGRLIDADAFDERIRIAGGMADEELTDDFKDGVQTTLLMLKTQKTIIEAEEGGG